MSKAFAWIRSRRLRAHSPNLSRIALSSLTLALARKRARASDLILTLSPSAKFLTEAS